MGTACGTSGTSGTRGDLWDPRVLWDLWDLRDLWDFWDMLDLRDLRDQSDLWDLWDVVQRADLTVGRGRVQCVNSHTGRTFPRPAIPLYDRAVAVSMCKITHGTHFA